MKSVRNLLSWPFAVVTVISGGLGLLFYGIAVAAACATDKIAGCGGQS